MNLFTPPPETKWNVLSLGAGVQSSCLALMASKGEITPMPDFAVFADTQQEPSEVYEWLDKLAILLPFPIYIVTKGDLGEGAVAIRHRKRDGLPYAKWLIPAFAQSNDNQVGILGRKCTADYKIAPINNKIKELCDIKRGQKNITVTQWIGISWDEMQRMKESRQPWCQMRFPLMELRMNRSHCLQWMRDNNYPEPPRSACTFCPFHNDYEWRRLRNEQPEDFQKAVVFEAKMQEVAKQDVILKSKPFLHRSCKSLGEIDFDNDEDKGQQVWDFQAECEGMCGV